MSKEIYHLQPETLHLLQQTAQFFRAQSVQAYLVGGSVRDLLLHVPCTDWDITTAGDAPALAYQLARLLGGSCAHMNDKASRITVKHNQQETILDIAPLHEASIMADLHRRDFTLNALAVPLAEAVHHITMQQPLPLIDPLHGADDLATHTLRLADKTALQHDPLRILRAVRFMHRYQLTIEPQTASLLTRDASLLTEVASERVHDELALILEPAGATARLRFLDKHAILMTLFPEFIPARGMPQPELHHWDVLEHSLEAVGYLEQLAALFQQPIGSIADSPFDPGGHGDIAALHVLLKEAEQQGIFHIDTLTTAPMKLAALLHDIGKTITYTVSEEGEIRFYGHPQAGIALARHMMHNLSASTQDRRLVEQVVAHHMRPGQLSHDSVTPRAIRRYFVDLGPVGINVALVSLADHLAMRGPEPLTASWERHLATVRLLLTTYIRERELILPPRLLQPNELIQRFNIQPGPIIGQLLERIAEGQTEGSIRSKEEALWLVEEIMGR